MNDFSQIAPLQDDLESSEQRRRNVLARRNERRQAAQARDSDDDEGEGSHRNRNKRSHEGGELFDGLMSDPSKRSKKGRTDFDRSKRNIGRKGNNKGNKGRN